MKIENSEIVEILKGYNFYEWENSGVIHFTGGQVRNRETYLDIKFTSGHVEFLFMVDSLGELDKFFQFYMGTNVG